MAAMHRRNGSPGPCADTAVGNVLNAALVLGISREERPGQVYMVSVAGLGLAQVAAAELAEFDGLQNLDASDNALRVEDLQQLPSLRSLKLVYNDIASIDRYCGPNFAFLTNLNLSYNRLTGDALTSLATFPALQKLNLCGNNLRRLPESLLHMEDWLSGVQANSEPDEHPGRPRPAGTVGFPVLESLDFSENSLGCDAVRALRILGHFPSLTALNLARNGFESLGALCPGAPHCASPASAVLFPRLRSLDVSDNAIAVPEALMAIVWIPLLAQVSIRGNPVLNVAPTERPQTVLMHHPHDPANLLEVAFKPEALLATCFNIAVVDGRPDASAPNSDRQLTRRQRTVAKPEITVTTNVDAQASQQILSWHRRHRQHTFNDADLGEMLRKGRLLSMRELEQSRAAQPSEPAESSEPEDLDHLDESANSTEPKDCPETRIQVQLPKTFLTDLHLTQGPVLPPLAAIEAKKPPSDENDKDEGPIAFPSNLLLAVRELRYAQGNPARYVKLVQQRQASHEFGRTMKLVLSARHRTPVDWLPASEMVGRSRHGGIDASANPSRPASRASRAATANKTRTASATREPFSVRHGEALALACDSKSRPASRISRVRPQVSENGRPAVSLGISELPSLSERNGMAAVVSMGGNADVEQQQGHRQQSTLHPHYQATSQHARGKKADYFKELVDSMRLVKLRVRLVELTLVDALDAKSYEEQLLTFERGIRDASVTMSSLALEIAADCKKSAGAGDFLAVEGAGGLNGTTGL